MKYDHRNALILGAGRSGYAAAKLLLTRGASVSVLDENWTSEILTRFAAEAIPTLAAPPSTLPQGTYDLIVASPSFPLEHPWIQDAYTRNIELISELELGGVYWRGDLIAITGSKGKSSVVRCLTHTLEHSGYPAVTAGNYGIPLCERVLECANNGQGIIAVTEVSSFQMEHTPTFSPRIAALLNLQADHLDRHGSMEAYTALKYTLLRPSEKLERVFLPEILSYPHPHETFGTSDHAMWRYMPHCVTCGEISVPVYHYFDNPVLGHAAALIVAILSSLGLHTDAIAEGFKTFEPLPHRMQQIATFNGITFINDSKATSLAATQAALQMVGKNIRLIAGGLLKENNVTFLLETLKTTTHKVYLIGSSQDLLYDAWSPHLPCKRCGTMKNAVRQIFSEATPGDTVLLSPGTASFDQYPGMAARGNDFCTQIQAHSTLQA